VWPFAAFRSLYLGAGGSVPAAGLVLWLLSSFSLEGNPAPLPYLPFVNPLELAGIFSILALYAWLSRVGEGEMVSPAPPKKYLLAIVAILLFLLLNSIVARSVHFYGGIPYYPDALYHSAIFQAALAGLWGFGALAITVWATRRANRTLWLIGAILLAMVVVKLFVVDLSGTGTIGRIVSFLLVGVLMLVIGYFSPIPPGNEEDKG
jgi:uncharacterized membrane protein